MKTSVTSLPYADDVVALFGLSESLDPDSISEVQAK
jgi:hypothetical protein